jgi:hypothetical protein
MSGGENRLVEVDVSAREFIRVHEVKYEALFESIVAFNGEGHKSFVEGGGKTAVGMAGYLDGTVSGFVVESDEDGGVGSYGPGATPRTSNVVCRRGSGRGRGS